jgi:hypothetical protein
MAYPIIPAPYGFKAVSEFGGLPYSGSTRMYPIATAYGTSLFNGDIVQLSGGTIVTTTMSAASSPATPVAGTLGIFVGAEYTNSSSQIVRGQYYPASTTSNAMVGYVIDDPRTVFKAVMVAQGTSLSNTASTVGYANATFIGTNLYAVTGTAGNTTTGDSAMAVSGAVITSGTSGNTRIATLLPWRVVGMVQDTAVTVTAVGGNANSSGTTITLTAANTAIQPGMQLVAQGVSGVAQGNYISVTNVNGTTVTLGSSIAVPTGTNLSFVGFPEVLVVWNATFQGMTNTAGV